MNEQIFNQAIEELMNGSRIEDVVLRYPESRQELSALLATVSELRQMPKNTIPAPRMQRKYLTAESRANAWLAIFHFSRFAGVAMSLAAFLIATGATAYATLQSLPGQRLFGLKKSAEQLQFKLVSDPVEKASMYVALSEKRLKEAEYILSSGSGDPKLQAAALSEASQQTKYAVEEMHRATQADALNEKNKPVVEALENVAKKQQTLIQQLESKHQAVSITSNTLETVKESESKISEIRKTITIAAAGKEQALTILSPDPDTVQVSGIIGSVGRDRIIVEKTPFTVTDQTKVHDAENKPLKISEIPAKSKVNVMGKKIDQKIVAQEIIVVSAEGETKGTATASSTPRTAATSSPAVVKKPASVEPATTPEPEQNTAQGTFILEDPAPQFVP